MSGGSCPNCGSTYATKQGYTFWGGMLGPAIFHSVKCNNCGTAYNGKTGKSNTTAIVIYVVVSFVIFFLLFFFFFTGLLASILSTRFL